MPRREYLKYFARDRDGNYVGSEKEQGWSVKELDDTFGAYSVRQPRKWVLHNEDGQAIMEEEK